LILCGKIIDTVLFKSDPLPDTKALVSSVRIGDLSDDTQALFLRNTDDAVQKLKSWVKVSTWSDYPTGESPKDALQRTDDVQLAAERLHQLDLRFHAFVELRLWTYR
jgi:hypothetical protein